MINSAMRELPNPLLIRYCIFQLTERTIGNKTRCHWGHQVDILSGGESVKKIEAIIRPSKLEELKAALAEIEVRGMTIYEVMGRGLQRDQKQYYRGQEHTVDLFPKVKVELICRDHWLERIIEVILKTCRTGNIGDGKIFVYPIEDIIRISSGERGDSAL
jgi:nitrogen regulatory protein P-II 1